jgi:glutathione S-transferase
VLVLYDHPASSNALKARFLLAELGLPYERRHIPFAQPRPESYVALNPFGRIPTLVDGDLALAESNAILRYLAGRERRHDLYPEQPRDRARVDWAMDAWSTQIRPPLARVETAALFATGDREAGGGSAEDADPDEVAATLPAAEKALDLYEAFVAGNGSVTGSFTIADCCVGPVLWRTKRLPMIDFGTRPKLARLRDAIEARPSFQAAGPVG